MSRLIGVIDAGTNKIRFVIYNSSNFEEVCFHELAIRQITDSVKEGYLEHDPKEIIEAVRECAKVAINLLPNHGFSKANIACVGVTNQRETVVLWNKSSGEPLHNAIGEYIAESCIVKRENKYTSRIISVAVWKDTRTTPLVDELLQKLNVDKDHFRELSGLPISSLPSALKILWLEKFIPSVREACLEGNCLAGTIDSWIVWNLTRGLHHVTDVTNASRTYARFYILIFFSFITIFNFLRLLMNLSNLSWDPQLTKAFSIDERILPEIKSSSEIIGNISDGSSLDGIPISAIIGNQQASLLGQLCFKEGQAKSTYRSGCFLLFNIGSKPVYSSHGLVTTVGYKFGKDPPVYALEGNIAIGGAALKWLKDSLGLLNDQVRT